MNSFLHEGREPYMMQFPHRVYVFKNGIDIGWYKDLESGRNAVEALCAYSGFDVTQYEFRDSNGVVVWRGSSENN
jgi:hypothetical protein